MLDIVQDNVRGTDDWFKIPPSTESARFDCRTDTERFRPFKEGPGKAGLRSGLAAADRQPAARYFIKYLVAQYLLNDLLYGSFFSNDRSGLWAASMAEPFLQAATQAPQPMHLSR